MIEQRAYVRVSTEFAVKMLNLPVGTRIRGASFDFPSDTVVLLVEHEFFPETQVVDFPEVKVMFERVLSSYVLPKT